MKNKIQQIITPEQVVCSQTQYLFPESFPEGYFWVSHNAEQNPLTRLIWSDNAVQTDILPESCGVRSKVHEYGGVPYTVSDRSVFWIDEISQQILQAPLPDTPETIALSEIRTLTHEPQNRYGEPVVHPIAAWIVAIEEVHTHTAKQPQNRLIALHPESGKKVTITEGADFYTSPTFSADGKQLLWIEWDHPHQPWTSTRLCSIQWPETVSDNTDFSEVITLFPESDQACSVQQPSFSDDNAILFISDHGGFWNLYTLSTTPGNPCAKPRCLYSVEADCASAPWQFGNRHYALIRHPGSSSDSSSGSPLNSESPSDSEKAEQPNQYILLICVCREGAWQLDQIRWADGLNNLPYTKTNTLQSFSSLNSLSVIRSNESGSISIMALAASYSVAPSVIQIEASQTYHTHWHYLAENTGLPGAIHPESISLELPQHSVHGLFYPCPTQSEAPLMINVHGGPTSCAFPGFQSQIQFWCQQGFSVLDLNHRGSTGFGRAFRDQLKAQWGEADLEDARLLTHYLSQNKRINDNKVVIRGQSAGGYCALRAATLGYFNAAVSLYGISDLKRLADSTHKFESHYLNWLIGDPDQDSVLYQLRSPLYSLGKQEQLPALLLFQGALDPIVPVDQMSRFAQLYKALGHQCETFVYEDEAHGFRQYGNRLHQLNTELSFYRNQGILPDH